MNMGVNHLWKVKGTPAPRNSVKLASLIFLAATRKISSHLDQRYSKKVEGVRWCAAPSIPSMVLI